jgi:serine protease Do
MDLLSGLKRQKLLSLSLLLFTLSIGIVIGTLVDDGVRAAKEQVVAPDATPLVLPSATAVENEFTKLAKQMGQSVVNITVETESRAVRTRRNRPPSEGEEEEEDGMDLFRRFFRGQPDGGGRLPRREATGSGFIVDKNGYILTNQHVVERAEVIRVKLPGETSTFKAKLIGDDIETDLAVIKIDPAGRNLTPVKIGNSDSVLVGNYVVAIGSPFGLEATVTAGIVSATGRDVGAQQFQHFIQTDAAINPGNSGGPLLNISGEVIGINTAIATASGGYQGVGFALPVNTAVKVYNSIIQSGRVTRGSIGIEWSPNVTQETLRALGLSHGVLVGNVTPGGPADKAGIAAEDVILALNGTQIKNGEDLVDKVADLPVGSDVSVTIDRDGKKLEKKLTIGDRAQVFEKDPRFRRRPQIQEDTEPTNAQAKFGIHIRNITEQEKESLKFDDKRGVMVTTVIAGSFAQEIGVEERDIIVSINRHPVSSVEDVRKIQEKLRPGQAVAFRVMRANPAGSARAAQSAWSGQYLSGTLPGE